MRSATNARISYEIDDADPLRRWVFLDGKKVGDIRMVPNGFAYFPKGEKLGGVTLPTILDVKKSLEAE